MAGESCEYTTYCTVSSFLCVPVPSQSIFLSMMRSFTDTVAVILLPFMFFRVTTGECPKMNDIPVMFDTTRFTCMRHWYETGSDLYPEINACNGKYEGPCTEEKYWAKLSCSFVLFVFSL